MISVNLIVVMDPWPRSMLICFVLWKLFAISYLVTNELVEALHNQCDQEATNEHYERSLRNACLHVRAMEYIWWEDRAS